MSQFSEIISKFDAVDGVVAAYATEMTPCTYMSVLEARVLKYLVH